MSESSLSRRDFMLASGALALGACASPVQGLVSRAGASVKIARIEVFPVRYPMVGYFKFFTGPHGSAGRAAVIVKLTADNGLVGWGQSVPIAKWSYETLETATVALRDYFAPALIGRDPSDIEGAHRVMDATIAPGFSTGMPISRAGIDLALHDLVGKLTQQTLAEMWGKPAGEPLDLSWTVNVKKIGDVDSVVDAGWQRGYRNFNIKVAPDPVFDVELAKAVRARAQNGFLWADANGGYDPATALEVAPKLADAGVDVLEAPIRPNRISGYRALKKQGALPILMDEGVVSVVELEEFIDLEMIDGVAMKPSRCGGLLSARRQIELIESRGLMWVGSGLTDPDLSMAATVALYAAYGLKKPAALNGPQFLTANLSRNPLRIEAGRVAVPEGYGLGVDFDEDALLQLSNRGR